MVSLISCSLLVLTTWLRVSAAQSPDCGYHARGLEGSVVGPFSGYTVQKQSLRCQWTITVPPGYEMLLTFEQFSLEHLQSGHCPRDWVRMESLTSSGATKLLGVFCGREAPGNITSVGNQVRITYFYRGYSNGVYSYFTLKYKAVRRTDIEIAKSLIENKELKNENLPKAVSALFLLDNIYFDTGNAKAENITNQFRIKLVEDLVRNLTIPLSAGDLALHVSGLLAVCISPRSFYGVDLVYNLRKLVNGVTGIPSPYLYLTLCNAGEEITDTDVEKLRTIVENEKHQLFWLDYKAMSVLVLVCIRDRNLGYDVKKTLEKATAEIKDYQLADGGFGSLQTTSLVMQALQAAKASENGWNSKAAKNLIMNTMEQDHSFGSIQNLYAMAPIMNNKTLLNINVSKCDFSKDDVNDVSGNQSVQFSYSVWIGDRIDVSSTVSLKAPLGTKFLQFMRLAADQDEKFKFKSMKMKNSTYVYEIGGLMNDPSSGRYWTLYTGIHVLSLEPYEKGLDHYAPQDGEMAVMWYKTVTVEY